MSISRDELRTILKFGIHLAKVDNEFHLQEKEMLRRYMEAIHLTEDERREILREDKSLLENLGHLTNEAARELLMKLLCSVSYVDGECSEEEVAFIEKVLSKLEDSIFLLPKEEWGKYENEVFQTIETVV